MTRKEEHHRALDSNATQLMHTYCPDLAVTCYNGGSCNPNRTSSMPCNCRPEFEGKTCEIAIGEGDQSTPVAVAESESAGCSLDCQNGGKCKQGTPSQTQFERIATLPDLLQTKLDGTYFCDCPKGFGGMQCEYSYEVCGNGEHICLHGKKCVPNKKLGDYRQYSCECSGEHYCVANKRTYCSPDPNFSSLPEYFMGMAVPAFCFNNGVCVDQFVDGKLASACSCPHPFTGPHCEFIKSAEELIASPDPDYASSADNSNNIRPFVPLIFFACSVTMVGLWFVLRQWRRTCRNARRRGRGGGGEVIIEKNLHDFKNENFGAMSPNGSMLFPAFGPAHAYYANHPRGDHDYLHEVNLS